MIPMISSQPRSIRPSSLGFLARRDAAYPALDPGTQLRPPGRQLVAPALPVQPLLSLDELREDLQLEALDAPGQHHLRVLAEVEDQEHQQKHRQQHRCQKDDLQQRLQLDGRIGHQPADQPERPAGRLSSRYRPWTFLAPRTAGCPDPRPVGAGRPRRRPRWRPPAPGRGVRETDQHAAAIHQQRAPAWPGRARGPVRPADRRPPRRRTTRRRGMRAARRSPAASRRRRPPFPSTSSRGSSPARASSGAPFNDGSDTEKSR